MKEKIKIFIVAAVLTAGFFVAVTGVGAESSVEGRACQQSDPWIYQCTTIDSFTVYSCQHPDWPSCVATAEAATKQFRACIDRGDAIGEQLDLVCLFPITNQSVDDDKETAEKFSDYAAECAKDKSEGGWVSPCCNYVGEMQACSNDISVARKANEACRARKDFIYKANYPVPCGGCVPGKIIGPHDLCYQKGSVSPDNPPLNSEPPDTLPAPPDYQPIIPIGSPMNLNGLEDASGSYGPSLFSNQPSFEDWKFDPDKIIVRQEVMDEKKVLVAGQSGDETQPSPKQYQTSLGPMTIKEPDQLTPDSGQLTLRTGDKVKEVQFKVRSSQLSRESYPQFILPDGKVLDASDPKNSISQLPLGTRIITPYGTNLTFTIRGMISAGDGTLTPVDFNSATVFVDEHSEVIINPKSLILYEVKPVRGTVRFHEQKIEYPDISNLTKDFDAPRLIFNIDTPLPQFFDNAINSLRDTFNVIWDYLGGNEDHVPRGLIVGVKGTDFAVSYDEQAQKTIIELYDGQIDVIYPPNAEKKSLSTVYGSDIKRVEFDASGAVAEKTAIPQSEWDAFVASRATEPLSSVGADTKGGSGWLFIVLILLLGGIGFWLYEKGILKKIFPPKTL